MYGFNAQNWWHRSQLECQTGQNQTKWNIYWQKQLKIYFSFAMFVWWRRLPLSASPLLLCMRGSVTHTHATRLIRTTWIVDLMKLHLFRRINLIGFEFIYLNVLHSQSQSQNRKIISIDIFMSCKQSKMWAFGYLLCAAMADVRCWKCWNDSIGWQTMIYLLLKRISKFNYNESAAESSAPEISVNK